MIEISNERPAWGRQPGESGKAYAALEIFLGLGAGRTVAEVGRKLAKSGNLVDRWCQRWDWRNRALLYDADLAAQDRAARQQQRAALVETTLCAARGLLEAAVRSMMSRPGLDKHGNVVVDPATGEVVLVPPSAADLSAASTALNHAVKHLRLAFGLPTEHTRQDVELRATLQRALATQAILREVIEIQLCSACRARVSDTLQRLAVSLSVGERVE